MEERPWSGGRGAAAAAPACTRQNSDMSHRSSATVHARFGIERSIVTSEVVVCSPCTARSVVMSSNATMVCN
eukprot:1151720-Prymnesium_polylepis.1